MIANGAARAASNMRDILEDQFGVAEAPGRPRRSAIVSAESRMVSHHVPRLILARLPVLVIVVGRCAP
jgi:hypothetical protein